MKNVKNLLAALCALVSAASMAVIQPGMPVSEDAPVRVSTGLHVGLINNAKGFGTDSLGLGLGFAHNIGYDFEYGLAISGDWAAGGERLMTKEAEGNQGVLFGAELMARFMPEVAEAFRLGGVFGFGWSGQFGGDNVRKAKEYIAFGDLNLRLGPAVSYGFSDMVSMYFAPALTLTSIRVHTDKAPEAFKKKANLFGVELPLGFVFGASDNVSMFVEANNKFLKFDHFSKNDWRMDASIGINFAM